MCVCAGRGPWVTWGNLVERSGIQVMCPNFFAPLDCPLSAWPAWSPKHRMSRPKFKFRRPFLEIRPKMSQKSSEYRTASRRDTCIQHAFCQSGVSRGFDPPITGGSLQSESRSLWACCIPSSVLVGLQPGIQHGILGRARCVRQRDLRSRTCPAWALRLHPNVSHK